MRDRNYQWKIEDKVLERCNYRELWDAVSCWFSSDDMIDFLENFASNRDIKLDEDEDEED